MSNESLQNIRRADHIRKINETEEIDLDFFTIDTPAGEVINKYLTIPEAVTDSQVARHFDTQKLVSMVLADEISAEVNNYQFYCAKSGKPLAVDFGLAAVQEFIETHGEDRKRLIFAIQTMMMNSVAPRWLYTNGEALEKLAIADPIGYFIYSYFRCFPAKPKTHEEKWAEYNARRIMARDLDSIIYSGGIHAIMECNEAFKRYLSIMHPSKHTPFIRWDFPAPTHEEAIQHLTRNLLDNLARVIKREFNAGRLRINFDAGDIIRVKETYIGYSNTRQQRRARQESEIDALVRDIDEIFGELELEDSRWGVGLTREKLGYEKTKPKKKRVFSPTSAVTGGLNFKQQQLTEHGKNAFTSLVNGQKPATGFKFGKKK